LVKEGELVKKGQKIGRNQGAVSATQHAPPRVASYRLPKFQPPTLPAWPTLSIVIEPDGKDECGGAARSHRRSFCCGHAKPSMRAWPKSGIVGMGGAAFPSAIKLNLARRKN